MLSRWNPDDQQLLDELALKLALSLDGRVWRLWHENGKDYRYLSSIADVNPITTDDSLPIYGALPSGRRYTEDPQTIRYYETIIERKGMQSAYTTQLVWLIQTSDRPTRLPHMSEMDTLAYYMAVCPVVLRFQAMCAMLGFIDTEIT